MPIRGSVGASGDLCPLSHTFATLLGAGRFYTTKDRTLRPATELPFLALVKLLSGECAVRVVDRRLMVEPHG